MINPQQLHQTASHHHPHMLFRRTQSRWISVFLRLKLATQPRNLSVFLRLLWWNPGCLPAAAAVVHRRQTREFHPAMLVALMTAHPLISRRLTRDLLQQLYETTQHIFV